jgi:hypothetical protein
MSDILVHGHRSLLQIMKLLFPELDDSLGYMMKSENHVQLIPVDAPRFLVCLYVCIPPVSGETYEVVRGQQDLLPIVALHNLKFLLYDLEPIIIRWFHRVREAWWLGSLEISKQAPLLHIDHCLMHSMEHLGLYHRYLF